MRLCEYVLLYNFSLSNFRQLSGDSTPWKILTHQIIRILNVLQNSDKKLLVTLVKEHAGVFGNEVVNRFEKEATEKK